MKSHENPLRITGISVRRNRWSGICILFWHHKGTLNLMFPFYAIIRKNRSGILIAVALLCHHRPNRHRTIERTWQKLGKSTKRDWNLVSSESGQDTSACQMLCYSFHAFSSECAGTSNSTRLRKSEVVLKCGKWTNCDQNVISSEGGQDTSAYQIPGHSLHAFSWECRETPNFTCLAILFWPV